MRRKAEPTKPEQTRDRHGFRGVPPPAEFDLYALPDRAALTELETAAVGRWSTNTLAAWRRVPHHPLEWFVLPGGFIRYFAGCIKRYLSMGTPRKGRSAKPATASQRRASKPDDAVTTEGTASPRRRAARPRAAGGLAVAPADDTGVAHG